MSSRTLLRRVDSPWWRLVLTALFALSLCDTAKDWVTAGSGWWHWARVVGFVLVLMGSATWVIEAIRDVLPRRQQLPSGGPAVEASRAALDAADIVTSSTGPSCRRA